ncbi:hypothetical protein Hanom_Chr11g01054281 [Helianthus anomalus]
MKLTRGGKMGGFGEKSRKRSNLINRSKHFFIFHTQLIFKLRVKYTDGPCGLPKLWIWTLAFQKYIDCPCGTL